MSQAQRQARILAMQALCQWDAQRDESPEALGVFLDAQAEECDSRGSVKYAATLVRMFWADADRVDAMIATAAARWKLARMSSVDRNAMRVAVAEWFDGKVPHKVVLNEAIEIGRAFGSAESPRFINGVLDAVLQAIKKDTA